MKRILTIWIVLQFVSFPIMKAQSLWTSAEVQIKLARGLNTFVEGEFRTHDGISATERWSGTIGLDYKLFSFLKAGVGYTYIHQQIETETTKKGNIIPSYWQPRHRIYLALNGCYEWKRFTFSLRERYQYTHREEHYVSKFEGDGITPKEDEWIASKDKHTLRSRMEIEYNIKRSKFKPFVSFEIYNSLTDNFEPEKTRWTVGTDYKFNKKHSLNLFYRYIDESDEDEENGHIIGIGYKFKL